METNNDYTPDQALRDAANAQADMLEAPPARLASRLFTFGFPLVFAGLAFGPVMPSPWGAIWSGILVLAMIGIGVAAIVLARRGGIVALAPKTPTRVWLGPTVLMTVGFIAYMAVRIAIDRADGDQWISVWAGLGYSVVVFIAILWLDAQLRSDVARLRAEGAPR